MIRFLWLRQLRRLFVSRPYPAARRRQTRPRTQLWLESLEDRVVPAGGTTTFSVPAGNTQALIQAINEADATSGGAVINLAANSTYTLTTPYVASPSGLNGYWYGAEGLPPITNTITINGNGSTIERASTTASGAATPDFRLFMISGGTSLSGNVPIMTAGDLTLNDLTLSGGVAEGGASDLGGGGLGAGGAIFNMGTLNTDDVTISGNSAIGGASGVTSVTVNSTKYTIGDGGGGMDDDTYTGAGTTAEDEYGNAPPNGDGGGFGGPVLTGATSYAVPAGAAGTSGGGEGGGGAGFTKNATTQQGAGSTELGTNSLSNSNGGDGGAGGGGVAATTGTAIGGNGGDFGAGGGTGGDVRGSSGGYNGSYGGGGGGVGGGGAEGQASRSGGGVSGAGGYGGFGGGGGANGGLGGFGGGGGVDTTITGFGGGIDGGGGMGAGGAIFNLYGTANLVNTTISGNTAQGGSVTNTGAGHSSGTGGDGFGGGIFNVDGTMTLTYVTVAANTAAGGTVKTSAGGTGTTSGSGDGGGIYNLAFGNLVGTSTPATATLNLFNNIIGQNTGTDDLVNNSTYDSATSGLITTATIAGNTNLIPTSNVHEGNGTDVLNPDVILNNVNSPNLGTLGNNGGSTETMLPASDSPAIGAANANLSGLPTTDQRGVSRPTTGDDLGAVQGTTSSSGSGSGSSSGSGSGSSSGSGSGSSSGSGSGSSSGSGSTSSSGSGSGSSSGSGSTIVSPTIALSVSNQYPGFEQLETITATILSPSGVVNGGVVTFQVDGQTVSANVVNGQATVQVATSFFDTAAYGDVLGSHTLTASYSGNGSVAFASLLEPAILLDYYEQLIDSYLQYLSSYPILL